MTSRFTIATCLLSTASCRLLTSHFNLPTQNSLPIRSLVHQSIGILPLLPFPSTEQITVVGGLATDTWPLCGMLRHCGCCLVSVSYISIKQQVAFWMTVGLLLFFAYCQLPTADFPLQSSNSKLPPHSLIGTSIHWGINYLTLNLCPIRRMEFLEIPFIRQSVLIGTPYRLLIPLNVSPLRTVW